VSGSSAYARRPSPPAGFSERWRKLFEVDGSGDEEIEDSSNKVVQGKNKGKGKGRILDNIESDLSHSASGDDEVPIKSNSGIPKRITRQTANLMLSDDDFDADLVAKPSPNTVLQSTKCMKDLVRTVVEDIPNVRGPAARRKLVKKLATLYTSLDEFGKELKVAAGNDTESDAEIHDSDFKLESEGHTEVKMETDDEDED
jgi:hypothetical protein